MASSLPSQSVPLGRPLPLDEHACSVSLPTWSSVVGYEEGSPQIISKLACGYPRFVYHPYVIQLMDAALDKDLKLQTENNTTKDDYDCVVLPSKSSALRCHDFLVKACGYLDGKAISPRICQDSAFQVVGDWRIHLFSCDNAVEVNDLENIEVYDSKSPIRVLELGAEGVHAVIFPAKTMFALEAKSYWQHTGEVVSSRRAECALDQLGLASNKKCDDVAKSFAGLKRVTNQYFHEQSEGWKKCRHSDGMYMMEFPSEKNTDPSWNPFAGLQKRIASITQTPESCIFLTPSGMSSIYHALRSSRRYSISKNKNLIGGTSIVFGFPYLDTLKMCSRKEFVPEGVHFFGYGDKNDLESIEKMLKEREDNNGGNAGVSALITEFPSNPLLNCPDLLKLRALSHKYDFALIIDDTIGNFANLDLIHSGLADVVCTSLTKLFNGRGDAMAGSIVTNPNTNIGKWLQNDLNLNHKNNEGLYESDASAVYMNSSDFLDRSSRINRTTEALVDWLSRKDEVEELYYPKYTCPDLYNNVLNKNSYGGRHHAGYGGLFSLVLRPHVCRRAFFDQINISKGPSLGTNFSLSCPYTLLAHYHELDFALTYNVQPGLIRFAIGLEDFETLKNKFEIAFQESRLHPKIHKMNGNQARSYSTLRETRSIMFHRTKHHSSAAKHLHSLSAVLDRSRCFSSVASADRIQLNWCKNTFIDDLMSLGSGFLYSNQRIILKVSRKFLSRGC